MVNYASYEGACPEEGSAEEPFRERTMKWLESTF